MSKTQETRTRRFAQRGFGMVETMVSLAVLSVGLLGLAGLQAAGARANYNAYLQSQATVIAQDMFERIRSNPDGDYAILLGAGLPIGNAACIGAGANCTADDLARFDQIYLKCATGLVAGDVACTNRGIPALLPGGDASIAVAGNDFTLTIQWFDTSMNQNTVMVFNATIET